MKAFSKYAALAVAGAALGALAMGAGAQPPDDNRQEAPPRQGERPPRPEGRRPPPPPLETALDADQDGEISAAEIENAASALKKLDKNGDAKLTAEEYRPPRPPMSQGENGRPGDFGQRRRGGNRDGDNSPFPEGGRPVASRDCPPDDGDEGANAEGRRERRGPPRDRELAGPDENGSRRGPPRERQGGGPREDRGRGGPPRDSRAFAERVLQFDENGDQKVAQDELPQQLQRLLEQGDTNNDNVLDRAELERLGERSSGRQGRRPPPPREADEGDDRPRRPSDD